MTGPPNGGYDDPVDADGSADVANRLSDLVVPLATTEPAADRDDLAPLRDALAGRTVVGLGEATHGTREFFRLKHRLIRLLVEELGVRLVALETNFAATLPVNEYVTRGRGDLREALANPAIHFPLRSEAVVDLLEWLRAFNEGRPADDRVVVHGVDMQHPFDAADALADFLAEADPDRHETVRADLEELAAGSVVELHVEERRTALVERVDSVVTALSDAFEENASAYAEATSQRAFERARHHLRTLSQGLEQRRGNALAVRDEAMAENVAWLLDHESADSAVVWAHNAHVERGAVTGGVLFDAEVPSMGEHLHRRYGDGYYPIGFEFGGGACRVHSGTTNEFERHELDVPPEGSLPAALDDVGQSPLFLDAQRASEDPVVGEWLAGAPERHLVVGSYGPDDDGPVTYQPSTLDEDFDGLVFVREASPSVASEEVLPDLGGE